MALRLVTPERLAEIRFDIETDLACTSAWRAGKQHEFPDDKRNGEASACLDEIAMTVRDIPDAVLLRFAAAWERDDIAAMAATEAWSEEQRHVGFYSAPSTARQLVESFLAQVEPRLAEVGA